MAEKRMFAKQIIDSDAFLDMPLSTQALYFHLSMRADDDGFIDNPRKIQRMISATNNDLDLLLEKRYLLKFESGVMVIKHWRMHNTIRTDRYKETVYLEEKNLIEVKENKSYTERRDLKVIECNCDGIPDGNQMATQIRLDKIRLDKESNIVEQGTTADIKSIVDYLNEVTESNYKYTTSNTKKHINARLLEGYTIDDFKKVIDKKYAEWKDDSTMVKYLRPDTLFGRKFESYLNQKESKPKSKNNFNNFKQRDYDFEEIEKRMMWVKK